MRKFTEGGGVMRCKKVVFFASFLILTAFSGVSAAKTVPDDEDSVGC